MNVIAGTDVRHFALIGTPNSGKTALFNALTGSRQKVANYPGVTVERKTGALQTASGHIITLVDLPDYKLPRPRSIAIGLFTRAKMFLQRAGTTIFSMMVVIWFLASFPRPPAGATKPAIDYSLAAIIGHWVEPLLAPVGFNWQISVALVPGMAAREVAVAALGTVYAIQDGKDAAEQIGHVLASQWSLATALALLVWYIFAPQCASTLAVIRRETGSWRWMAITFGYMLALTYIASLIVYQVAVALGG